jgi:hypothetical protein
MPKRTAGVRTLGLPTEGTARSRHTSAALDQSRITLDQMRVSGVVRRARRRGVAATCTVIAAVLGGTLAATMPVAASSAQTIVGFSPTSGTVGAAVVISGSGFSGATAVDFGTVAATFTVESDSTIDTSVPDGATTSPITVDTPAGDVTSTDNFSAVFNVTSYGAIGNGTGDNTSAFKAAIAAAQNAGSGNVVYVPAGTYTFASGSPASVQINGTVPITLEGAGAGLTTLQETERRRDLLNVKCNGTIVEDLMLDTQTYQGGHALGVGASYTTVENVSVISGPLTFGIYYPGPPHDKPGDTPHSEDNVLNNITLNDQYKGDGWSFAYQDEGSISNVHHTGSRISIYADTNTTITNYYYTPGKFGATAGFVISTPSDNITITNFVTSGEGGEINTAPDEARVNQNITINGEQMTGGSKFRLLIGDVQNLLIENSTLDGIIISPKIIAQGTVTSTTYTSVKGRGHGLDQVTFP